MENVTQIYNYCTLIYIWSQIKSWTGTVPGSARHIFFTYSCNNNYSVHSHCWYSLNTKCRDTDSQRICVIFRGWYPTNAIWLASSLVNCGIVSMYAMIAWWVGFCTTISSLTNSDAVWLIVYCIVLWWYETTASSSWICPSVKYLVLHKYLLRSLNHIHIWQVSPQLSCGETCQILTWYSIPNMCFHKCVFTIGK